MNTTTVLLVMALYLVVIALLGVIDWKLTKIIEMMGNDGNTSRPNNKPQNIEYR